jgi:hypothetical protein
MLRLTTYGNAFQRGQQQGQATRNIVLPWMERCFAALQERHAAPSRQQLIEQLRPRIDTWRHHLHDLYPEGAAECCGLADGLGLDEDTYFILAYNERLSGQLPQCTLVATRHQRPLVGKTDDIAADELGLNVLEVTTPDSGYRHLHFHFAGTIWTVAGVNECGLAMGMTGIPGPQLETSGLYSLDALHTILPRCADVEEAIAHIRALQLNCYGFSLALTDPQGGLALVEKTAVDTVLLDTALLAHTNHILDPDFAQRNPHQSEPVHSNGERRLENAYALLQSGLSPAQIMANRSAPGAICQRGEDGLHTDFAVVFDPLQKQLHLWPGYPDQVEMETLKLDEIFKIEE